MKNKIAANQVLKRFSSQNRKEDAFKLGLEAQKHWRRLNGSELLAKVVTGVKFVDGEEQIQEAA